MQPPLLAKLHTFDEPLLGIAPRKWIMGITYQHSLDARLVGGEVVSCLERWEKIIVIVLVCRRVSDDDIDVGSDFEHRIESNCGRSVLCNAY
jgi:hypothetical protein